MRRARRGRQTFADAARYCRTSACTGGAGSRQQLSGPRFSTQEVFGQHCAFGFWKGGLVMADAPRDAMGHLGKITALSDLPTDRTLIGYVRKAARLNETGAKAPTRARAAVRTPLRIPDYFAAALDRNKAARATFERFSPSHKKEYVEWVTEAKRDETRQKRLNTAVEWMAEGKVRNWKYVRAR